MVVDDYLLFFVFHIFIGIVFAVSGKLRSDCCCRIHHFSVRILFFAIIITTISIKCYYYNTNYLFINMIIFTTLIEVCIDTTAPKNIILSHFMFLVLGM